MFLLYVLIKNFLGTTKFWGTQKIWGALPSNSPRVYGPGFNALPDIFTVMNCSVLGAVDIIYVDSDIVAYNIE